MTNNATATPNRQQQSYFSLNVMWLKINKHVTKIKISNKLARQEKSTVYWQSYRSDRDLRNELEKIQHFENETVCTWCNKNYISFKCPVTMSTLSFGPATQKNPVTSSINHIFNERQQLVAKSIILIRIIS